MAKAKKNKNKNPLMTSEKSPHSLLEPDDWSDPPDRKVLGEYHKKSNDAIRPSHPPETKEETTSAPAPFLRRIIDLSSVELIAYALTRAVFPKGVQVPVYMKGMVDMDIAIKETNVIINTNDVSFQPPLLQLWRFIFSYKGKPVFEYGQGVKNMIKIHHSRAIAFLIAMWVAGRKRRKNQKKKTEDERRTVSASSEQNKKDLSKTTL